MSRATQKQTFTLGKVPLRPRLLQLLLLPLSKQWKLKTPKLSGTPRRSFATPSRKASLQRSADRVQPKPLWNISAAKSMPTPPLPRTDGLKTRGMENGSIPLNRELKGLLSLLFPTMRVLILQVQMETLRLPMAQVVQKMQHHNYKYKSHRQQRT